MWEREREREREPCNFVYIKKACPKKKNLKTIFKLESGPQKNKKVNQTGESKQY